jgi:hypothetical protein
VTTGDAAPTGDAPPAAPRRLWVLWMVAGLAYAVDAGSKAAVVAWLEGRAPVPVIGTWLELQVQRNPGPLRPLPSSRRHGPYGRWRGSAHAAVPPGMRWRLFATSR